MIRKSLVILAVAALLALLVNGWVSDRATRVLIHAVGWVEHTYQVLQYLDRFRASMAEAETAARGFAITGNAAFKDDFARSSHSIRHNLENIRIMTADSPKQSAAVAAITPPVSERLNLLTSLVQLRERSAAEPNVQLTVLNGALLTRSIAVNLEEIRTEELRLLREREATAERARKLAIRGPLIRLSVALVMLIALMTQVWLTLRNEAAAREKLENAVADEKIVRRRAEEADRLKDEFLATLSHELRTPLTSMVGWSSLLQDPQQAPELLHQGIRSISEAARVQARLIEDLLDISRIVSGKLHIMLGPVDLPGVIRDAIASVSPSAQAKGIAIRTVLDETLHGVIGDPARLQQVVWNLLTNAVKFTPKGGHIDVLLRRVNSHIEISVTDDGDGIEPEFLPHVFDRFRQADSSATRRAGGLGIGLSIVKSLVEAHGGAVRVESAGHGKGAAFHVELPILGAQQMAGVDVALATWRSAQFDPEPSLATTRSLQPVLLSGRTILVIDDDPRTLQLVTTMLSQAGARLLTAANTADGLALLESERPDLVICDIGMPGEDGLTFIRRLRKMLTAYAQVPAIALTAFARADDRVTALGAGFNAYLAKPVTREELVIACASLLRLVPDRRVHTDTTAGEVSEAN